VIKKAREEARAGGLSGEEERKAVQEALKAFEGAATPAAPAPAPAAAKPAEDRAAKIALAQKKAEAIKKARDEARAQGLSPEDERKSVQEALRRVAEEDGGG
ncbi:MAG: hypothetical protein HYS09_07235, partial [Chloroflexi bacterium]|nr:hypothetical protein [Chloroflexota bacterium]